MTQKRKKLALLPIKTRRSSSNPSSEIVEESRKWVSGNKGLKLQEGCGYYGSPRISSEAIDCSMPMTFDQYLSCSLGCLYCFAYFFKSNNPALKTDDGNLPLKSINVKKMISAMEGGPTDARGRAMYKHFYSKKFLLHWGGLADPFCHFESANRVGYPLLKALGDMNYPTLFSFKGRTILEKDYLRIFEKYAKQSNFAFQVSIITFSDKLAKNIEIGVPSVTMRLKITKMLSQMGYWTVLRLRPYIIGISDQGLDELLHASLDAGIRGISMEFFALDARANVGMKTRYEWLSKFMGLDGAQDMMHYFTELSPSERGGYRRLNRLVKQSHVKKVYEFCQENDLIFACSDPDYKELNTSGSCCGMPDSFPENPLLENWSRDQMTYHVKEARRIYHSENKIITFNFKDVFSSEATYLDDPWFTNDHVAVTGMTEALRKNHTWRTIIQTHWNNLKSPGNPRNYFHGKVLPVGLDEDGNLTYKYNPLPYEEEWKEEGLDLER